MQPVHRQRLGQDLAHRHARVERGIGVLEDDLHVPAQAAQRVLAEVGDLLALEADRARGRLHQAQHQPAGRRLAAARFADQRQRLAAGDLEAHVLDRAHQADHLAADSAAADREVLDQTVDLQDGRGGIMPCSRAFDRRLPAGDAMLGAERTQRRRLGVAAPVGERAARREAAALGLTVGAGHRALDGRQPLALDVEARDRAQQADRVGMLRIGEQGVDRRALDDLAGVHHQHVVGDLGDHAEIVGDDQDRHAEPRAAGPAAGRGSAPGW